MSFTGGYIFKHFEGIAEPVVRECSVPETVYIPAECSLLSFAPLVKKGDSIRAGRKVMQAHNELLPSLVSPVNGTIKDITEKGITITSDGTADFEPVAGHLREPWHLDHETVVKHFCSSGCMSLLNGNFSSLSDFRRVTHIIVNAVHNAPLNQSWSPHMIDDPWLFLSGLKTLDVLFPETQITIAHNKRSKKYFGSSAIKKLASVRIMSDRYPQENPELISRDTIHQRFISPEGIRNDAILVIPFLTAIQIAEIMSRGRPFTDRLLMIAGPGVSNPGWYRVRIGTPFEEIKRTLLKSDEYGPWRIIRGNLFTGKSVTSLKFPILPTDSEISVIREYAVRDLWRFMNPGFSFDSYSKATVAEYFPLIPKQLDSNVHGGVRPCIQCNYCDEVCPVALYPHLIWKYVQADKIEDCFRFKPYECIECGLCDYVCPSKIDISQSVIKAKELYRSQRSEGEISD